MNSMSFSLQYKWHISILIQNEIWILRVILFHDMINLARSFLTYSSNILIISIWNANFFLKKLLECLWLSCVWVHLYIYELQDKHHDFDLCRKDSLTIITILLITPLYIHYFWFIHIVYIVIKCHYFSWIRILLK